MSFFTNNKTSFYFLGHLKEIRDQYDQDLQQDRSLYNYMALCNMNLKKELKTGTKHFSISTKKY